VATPDKDCEELRKEHSALSDQLRRGAILSLTVLSLFVISFARACDNVNGDEAKKLVCQIEKTTSISREERNVSYVFENFDSANTTCDEPCPLPSPSATASSTSTPTPAPEIVDTSLLPPRLDSGAASAPASPQPTPTEAQRKAHECQKKLEASLEQSAQQWFGVEAPIPGIHITLDLRYWVFLLPLLFFLSAIYLHTLRMKLRVLKALGAYRLSTANQDEVTVVNRLYFEKHSAYGRFPSTPGGILFVVVYLLLPAYLLIAGRSFWADWSGLLLIGFLFAALTFYSVALGHAVTNRLDEEIARLTDQPKPHNLIRNASEALRKILKKIARILSPRIPLSTGSLLLFITLALAITESGCDDVKTYRGYQVLVGTQGASWYTASEMFEQIQGRLMYSAALLLALFVALLILFSPLYRNVTRARLWKFLLGWSGGVCVLSLIDFSAGSGIRLWGGKYSFGIWLILMAVWIRYGFSRKVTNREKWMRIRSPLIVFSVPFFILALVFTLEHLRLPGLLVYFIGVNSLFLGVLQLPYAPAAVAPQPIQPQVSGPATATD